MTSGTLYLITDLGIKFPLASADVAKTLGYTGTTALPVPTELLALLPTGPSLDPAAASATLPLPTAPPAIGSPTATG
ncbi:type VII secretion protein EccB [Kitasatospora azatica]|uniref:type VII secretion protein EccB n=1 Tax=Kitasatospora azatica TaxID=58347 RepID=UPI00068E66AE|nr:type VII secretion protein EccB [Kitasatospora azatica]